MPIIKNSNNTCIVEAAQSCFFLIIFKWEIDRRVITPLQIDCNFNAASFQEETAFLIPLPLHIACITTAAFSLEESAGIAIEGLSEIPSYNTYMYISVMFTHYTYIV